MAALRQRDIICRAIAVFAGNVRDDGRHITITFGNYVVVVCCRVTYVTARNISFCR